MRSASLRSAALRSASQRSASQRFASLRSAALRSASRRFASWRSASLAIEHFRPDVLVVRDAIVSDYSDTSKAPDSRIGRIAYLDSHYFYRYLKEGRLPAYRQVKSFHTLTIFARNEALEPRTAAWLQLIRMFGRGKALGVSRARMKMAEVHLTVGRHDAASEQRELAYKAQNHALNQYNNAKELLFEGKMDEARGGGRHPKTSIR